MGYERWQIITFFDCQQYRHNYNYPISVDTPGFGYMVLGYMVFLVIFRLYG